MGFVFQSYNLIPHQTVLANVELALTLSGVSRGERRRRAVEALTRVGLADQLRKKPNQMSGGQMQRVAIARALVNDPEILLADEPTGALDSETSVQVMELLKEVARDRLVIMVTHNPELAQRYATRIVRLLDGKIIADSAPYDGEAPTAPKKHQHKRLPSMSFTTALGLSLHNLLTKKGRTVLTALAGGHRHHRHRPDSLPLHRHPGLYRPGPGGHPLLLPHRHPGRNHGYDLHDDGHDVRPGG